MLYKKAKDELQTVEQPQWHPQRFREHELPNIERRVQAIIRQKGYDCSTEYFSAADLADERLLGEGGDPQLQAIRLRYPTQYCPIFGRIVYQILLDAKEEYEFKNGPARYRRIHIHK